MPKGVHYLRVTVFILESLIGEKNRDTKLSLGNLMKDFICFLG